MRKFVKIIICALPMLAVMVGIFLFSGQQGEASAGVSNGVGEWLLGVLGIGIPPGMSASDVPIVFGLNIRKLAHVFLYMLLGGTSFLFMAMLPIRTSAYVRPSICAGGAVAISFVYACLDELHQSFIAGRDGKFADVGVDAIGFLMIALLILAIWYLVLLLLEKRRTKHKHTT